MTISGGTNGPDRAVGRNGRRLDMKDVTRLDLRSGIAHGDRDAVRSSDSLKSEKGQNLDPVPKDGRLAVALGDDAIGQATLTEIERVLICFTPSTSIATPKGEILVEELRPGDRVFTRDNGIQEIAWIGTRTVTADELAKTPAFQPVLVQANALGPNLPERDLLISQNHRILMSGQQALLHFEESEVLVAAKHLTRVAGVDVVQSAQPVTYVHIMFARHEVILANGCWTECFQPIDKASRGKGDAQRNEITSQFPELAGNAAVQAYGAARHVLKKNAARMPRR